MINRGNDSFSSLCLFIYDLFHERQDVKAKSVAQVIDNAVVTLQQRFNQADARTGDDGLAVGSARSRPMDRRSGGNPVGHR